MFIIGVLSFSLIVPLAAYRISKSADQDPGKVATLVVLVGWGSMMIGLILARI